MLPPEPNASGRNEAGPLEEVLVEGTTRPIDVVFDLDDPKQAESLERHRTAFGRDHCEVDPLGDGKVVFRLYPGGARRLL